MMMRARPWLPFALLTLLLVSADGDTVWAPAVPAAPPAHQPPPHALARPAPAAEPAAEPAQTALPATRENNLSDEFRRIRAARLSCGAAPDRPVDLFAGKSWYVPPPPPKPKPPPPPPPPTAPPLPFSFMGSYQEPDGRLIIFLTKGERLYTVSPGDVIDNTYRVEEVVAGQLGLTYLPLNIRQSMSVGETS
jgi:hypothetical protein